MKRRTVQPPPTAPKPPQARDIVENGKPPPPPNDRHGMPLLRPEPIKFEQVRQGRPPSPRGWEPTYPHPHPTKVEPYKDTTKWIEGFVVGLSLGITITAAIFGSV